MKYIVLILASLLSFSALAKDRVGLSDAGTVTDKLTIPLEWQKIVPGKDANNMGSLSFKVFLRVDTSQIKGQDGRLILRLRNVLPFDLKWNVTGGALVGQSESNMGEVVLWQGKIVDNEFKDIYTTNMTMDGRYLNVAQQLQFVIEWESNK